MLCAGDGIAVGCSDHCASQSVLYHRLYATVPLWVVPITATALPSVDITVPWLITFTVLFYHPLVSLYATECCAVPWVITLSLWVVPITLLCHEFSIVILLDATLGCFEHYALR